MELLCVLSAVLALFCGCTVLTLKCRVPASVAPLTMLSILVAVLTLAAMAGVFADHNVSVHSVIQRGKKDANSVDLTYVTHTAREKSVRAVLADIASLDDVLREEPSVIRVED